MPERKKPDAPKAAQPEPAPRKQKTLTEPSVRISTQWTPNRIRAVQQAADGGNMQQLADLCDQIIRDDRFGQCLQSLADGVLGSELTWERGLRQRRKNPDEQVPLEAEADNDWWEQYNEAHYALILIWREMLGFCWARLTWLTSPVTGRWVPSVEFWHPRLFRYDPRLQQWFVKVDDQNTERPVKATDGWVAFYRRSTARPWADGLWRGVSRWWMLKALAISDWGVHSEKAARQVIESDEGANAADRASLAADLYALSKDGVVVLPSGFKYSLVEATANTRDIYQAQVDAANMAGTVAILGQNLTTEISDNGSRAASETHERKERQRLRYVAESLSTTLREQIMLAWALYNFGAGAAAPWHVWVVAPAEDMAAKATTYNTLADAVSKFAHVGKAIPDEKLKEEFDLELLDVEPPAQPGEGETEPGGGKKPGDKPKPGDKKPGDKKPARAPAQARLASGLSAAGAKGFVSGQLYTDDVAEATAAKAATELEPFVMRLLSAIGKADSYEAIREAVHATYAAEEPPERLAELTEHALMMAHLGGQLAVREDT